jgi:hypothetical protein
MARVAADPVRGREGILLAHIFEDAWKQGKDLDLPSLILSIQNPPIKTLGVFDLDTVYPPQDRFSLAMAFNNLLASPSFQGWLTVKRWTSRASSTRKTARHATASSP